MENFPELLGDSARCFIFIHRSVKIRPVSVKTFDEVTMENRTDDSLGVSHTNVVLDLSTAAWRSTGVCVWHSLTSFVPFVVSNSVSQLFQSLDDYSLVSS